MRLSRYVLVLLFAALPAIAAQPASRPAAAQQATFSVGKALPKWVQPIPDPVPTLRHEPAVYRLLETQAWAGPHPAMVLSRALQVNDQSALGEIGEFGISYFPAYQKLVLNRVLVLRDNGVLDRTRSVSTRVLQREQELEHGVYGGAATVQLLLEDVRVGDTLWVTYTIEGANPVFGQQWADDFGWDTRFPVELRRLTVMHPRQRPLYWRRLGDAAAGDITPAFEQAGDIERLRFEERSIEAAVTEPSAPSDFVPRRLVQVSEYRDWQGVAAWAASLFPRTPPSPALRQLARQFAAEPQPTARAAAALHWVQDQIRYFSVSIGENSHRPQAPDTVLSRRYGDCKDKSYLLVSLLAELGIKAQPLLINAQAPRLVGKLIATPTWFDHVIVRLEVDGKAYYVDPTRNGQKGPLAQLPVPFPGGQGLLVDPDTRALTVLPERPDSYLPFERIENIAIASFDGDAVLETRDIYRDNYADWARNRYPVMRPSELNKEVLGEYEKRYPGVTLATAPRIEDHPDSGRFELVTRLNLRQPVTRADKLHQIEYASRVIDGSLGLPDNVVRTFPFALPMGKYHGRYRLNITWPKSVRDAAAPIAKTVDTRFFRVTEEYTFRGNHLGYLLDYRLKSDRVAAADLSPLQQESKKLNEFISGSFHVSDDALVEPENAGYSYRNLDATRTARGLVDWGSDKLKLKSAGEIDADELCGAVVSAARMRDLVAGTPAAAAFAQMDEELAHDARPAAARCLAGLLYGEGKFDAAIRLLAADKALGDDDPLVARLAWARVYTGDNKGAAADMARYVAARTGAGALNALDRAAQFALLERSGEPVPPALLAWAAEIPDGPWPWPLLAMQAGLIEPDALLGIAGALPADARELALNDAWFYIGQKRLAQHDAAGAAAAFRWYAVNGVRGSDPYVQAALELARMATADADYLAGLQAEKRGDIAAAIALWSRSAGRGVPEAQHALGNVYYDGNGVQRDYGAALRWWQLGVGQEYGPSLNDAAYMLDKGQGAPRDQAAAAALYRRAAAAGMSSACYNLGLAYRDGKGVPKSSEQAVAWFRQAAEMNDPDAQADMAFAYRTGTGIARDDVQAAFWARLSSQRNSDEGRIQFALLAWDGRGMPQDAAAGTAMLRLAAGHGSARAQYLLGEAYEAGKGVKADLAAAAHWYEAAARQGDADAQVTLGDMYLSGNGVARDEQRALAYYRGAAATGFPTALYSLGTLYEKGVGFPRDPRLAYVYYQIAGRLYSTAERQQQAAARRDSVARELAPADLTRADAAAAAWKVSLPLPGGAAP